MHFFKTILIRIINKLIFTMANLLNFIEEVLLMSKFVKLRNGAIIFDIGYNKGLFSKKILKFYKPKIIIGLEANADLLKNSFSDPKILKLNL